MCLKLCYCLFLMFVPQTGNSLPAAVSSSYSEPSYGARFDVPVREALAELTMPLKMELLLKTTEVHLEVTGAALHAEVTQVFFNHTDEVVEMEYTFPLPENATVTGLKLELAHEIVTSVVQERQQAKKTYTAATSEGKKALLLEQDRPNVFTTQINRLEPGEEVAVVLQYLQPLAYEKGHYKLVFPTTFGSRYFPKEHVATAAEVEAAYRLNPLYVNVTDNEFSLKANVFGLPILNVQSPTHDLYFQQEGDDDLFLQIDPEDHRPDRDVVLELYLTEHDAPQSHLLQSVSADGAHGLLQVFPPLGELDSVETRPKEVIFLIDTSGSMSGVSMDQARQGLKACLKMMGPEDRFNIVSYDDSYEVFRSETLELSQQNLAAGLKFADTLRADGGTELQPALESVLGMQRSPDHLPWIVLLTDGDVGNEKSLLNLVHRSEYRNRIFSFGVGSAPNRYLLSKLGEIGGGFATYVQPGTDLNDVMTGFFETVVAPVLTDIAVEFFGQDGLKTNVNFLPRTPPDLYLDRPLQLSFWNEVPLEGFAMVSGEWNGETRSFKVPIPTASPAVYKGVDQLYGRALVDDQLVDYNLSQAGEAKDRLKADIVKTAIDYQLLTPFTSRVAVSQQRMDTVAPVMASVLVPLARPESRAYYPPTATQDWLYLGLGLFFLAMAAGLYMNTRQRESV